MIVNLLKDTAKTNGTPRYGDGTLFSASSLAGKVRLVVNEPGKAFYYRSTTELLDRPHLSAAYPVCYARN